MKNVSLFLLMKKYTHFIDNLFKSLSSPTLVIKVIIINTIKGQVKFILNKYCNASNISE